MIRYLILLNCGGCAHALQSPLPQMRSLNLRRPLAPETLARYAAEDAAATLALAALLAPAHLPPDLLAEAFGPAATRYLFGLARQYQNQGLGFVELVLAGRAAVVKYLVRQQENPDREQAGWEWWWARQGMLLAVREKGLRNGLIVDFLV